MPPVILIQTVEVELRAERSGQARRNVIHYFYLGGRPTAAELDQLLLEVENGIIQEQEDLSVLGTRWYEAVATDMHDINGIQRTRSMNRQAAGGTQVFPGAVSLCLSKRTSRRGQSYRGRFFLFDLPEDFFNGDDLNPIYIPGINELVAQLILPRVSGRFFPAVGSRKWSGSTPFNVMTYDLISDTQVRRGKARGI